MNLPKELEEIAKNLREKGMKYLLTDEEGLIIEGNMQNQLKIAGLTSTVIKQIDDMLGRLTPRYYSLKLENKRIYIIRKRGFLIIIEK